MAVHHGMFGPTAMAYGLAAALVLALSLFASRERYDRHVDAVGCSVMLLLFWCICNILLTFYGLPNALLANPVINLIGTAVCGLMYATRPARWKAGVTLCFLTQSGTAVLFWSGYMPQHAYLLLDNIVFAMELAFVSVPGGLYVANRYGFRLFHRGAGRRLGLPQ